MISLHSINVTVRAPITIYTAVGAVADTLQPGNYVADMNPGQQPGWFSLYEADGSFNKVQPMQKLANIHLSINPAGQVVLTA